MGFDVKNTTKVRLLDWFCPHTCRGCGRLGWVLCDRCKNNILKQRINICPVCKNMVADCVQKCPDCGLEFDGLYVGWYREGVAAKIISEFKYQSVRALGDVLAEMLDWILPGTFVNDGEKSEVIVVPLPTIGKHVRERGFDHTWCLGKKLAKCRGWKCERVLERLVDTVQVGTKAEEREKQAGRAYGTNGVLDAKNVYVLLDDVWTTGATMRAAAKVIREAGAERVVGVVLATGKTTALE